MRPYLSVQIDSPAGPTTRAVCGPWVFGRGLLRRVPGHVRRQHDEIDTVFAALIVAAGIAVLFQMVVGLQRQVLAIVVGVRGVIQRKGAAGGDAQRGGGAPDLLMLGLPASRRTRA